MIDYSKYEIIKTEKIVTDSAVAKCLIFRGMKSMIHLNGYCQ